MGTAQDRPRPQLPQVAGQPAKPEELVVMSWAGRWGRGLREQVSTPFAQAAGIRIRHETNIGLKLPARLVEALEGGQRPPFDLVWSNAAPAMRMAQRGLCDPLDEGTVPNLLPVSGRAQPEGFSDWPMAAAYVVYYVLAYREAAFPQGRPHSWTAMLDPRYRGKIAVYPGGHGFFPIAQVLGGGAIEDIPRHMSPCWELFRKLRRQIGNMDYSIGMDKPIGRGEIDICFRALPNAVEFRDLGLGVSWSAPVEGIPNTTDVLWVPKGVPANAAYWSKQYINFALSQDVQERWCAMMGVMPVHPQAALGPELKNDDAFPNSADDLAGVLYVPERVKMEHEPEWQETFQQIMNE